MATAVHNGHDLRPGMADLMVLDDQTRLMEEDAHTSAFISGLPNRVIVHRSRFEVDLNRPPEEAVYLGPADAWGLELWKEEPDGRSVAHSLSLHDKFYERLSRSLDRMVDRFGGFVLYDVHSYNHRRSGPDVEPDPQSENPDVNVGTGSLPVKWRPVGEKFIDAMGRHQPGEVGIDVRENVKFKGRYVASWVHERYGDVGCALAIEFKKTYMDEWTGTVNERMQERLTNALTESVEPVLSAWRSACQ